MRLIDADETISELKTLPEQERLEFMGLFDLIKSMPTIDAEPVVRCKECKYFLKLNSERMCGKKLTTVNEDYYCSNGTKRNEEAK